MRPFTVVRGSAAPLPLANIDTDIIIRIERFTTGDPARLGEFAFEALRYCPDGSDDPAFPLNRPRWRGAPILIAGPNFGCGSSREPAVVAMLEMGLRCVIAASFGDIFYGNCFQNGLLPVRLDEAVVLRLMALAEEAEFVVSLVDRTIAVGAETFPFAIDAMRREALLAGLDDIELTLRETPAIDGWQARDRAARPWIWDLPAAMADAR